MPAFELIEDRQADYAQTDVFSMIIENCWNGGVVIGSHKSMSHAALVGIVGRLTLNEKVVGEGAAEDPYATLAWLANHLAERGCDLVAGMVVITGRSLTSTGVPQARPSSAGKPKPSESLGISRRPALR